MSTSQRTGDLFSGVLPFVHVAEVQSFTKAAERLGVTPAAVSKAIARLEEDLGVRLLNRTSRSVALTPEGAVFLERCKEAVSHLAAARELVEKAQRTPKGPVTVSMPFILGRLVASKLPKVAARHPGLTFHLRMTDRLTRLVEESVDVAIRVGELEDSSLVSRRLRGTRWVTLASPAYLARVGAPRTIDDLARHNCLKFSTPRGVVREWTFAAGGGDEARTVRTGGNFDVDQGELLLEAARAGLGVCQVLDFMVDDDLREGRLVEVLADHAAAGPQIHALTVPGRQSSPKVRAFLSFLVEELGRDATPRAG